MNHNQQPNTSYFADSYTPLSPTIPLFPKHFYPMESSEAPYPFADPAGATGPGKKASVFLLISILAWLAVLALVVWSVRQPVEQPQAAFRPDTGAVLVHFADFIQPDQFRNVQLKQLAWAMCPFDNCGEVGCPNVPLVNLDNRSARQIAKRCLGQRPSLEWCSGIYLVRSIRTVQKGRFTCHPSGWYTA
jgi:hypothetical protein